MAADITIIKGRDKAVVIGKTLKGVNLLEREWGGAYLQNELVEEFVKNLEEIMAERGRTIEIEVK